MPDNYNELAKAIADYFISSRVWNNASETERDMKRVWWLLPSEERDRVGNELERMERTHHAENA